MKTILKRYLVFLGDNYYPDGGWSDFTESFESIDGAFAHILELKPDWFEVVDITTGKKINTPLSFKSVGLK